MNPVASPCVLTNLDAGSSYSIRVRAVNGAGAGMSSGESIAVIAVTAPNPPTIDQVLPTAPGEVEVAWTPSIEGADSYQMFVSLSPTPTPSPLRPGRARVR